MVDELDGNVRDGGGGAMAEDEYFRAEDPEGGGGGVAAGELGPLSLRKALRAACTAIDPLMLSRTAEF